MRLMLSIQVIHFIRHGEGFHNVAGRRSTEEYKKEDYADAHLTELGWTAGTPRSTSKLCDQVSVVSQLIGEAADVVALCAGSCAAKAHCTVARPSECGSSHRLAVVQGVADSCGRFWWDL